MPGNAVKLAQTA